MSVDAVQAKETLLLVLEGLVRLVGTVGAMISAGGGEPAHTVGAVTPFDA